MFEPIWLPVKDHVNKNHTLITDKKKFQTQPLKKEGKQTNPFLPKNKTQNETASSKFRVKWLSKDKYRQDGNLTVIET